MQYSKVGLIIHIFNWLKGCRIISLCSKYFNLIPATLNEGESLKEILKSPIFSLQYIIIGSKAELILECSYKFNT